MSAEHPVLLALDILVGVLMLAFYFTYALRQGGDSDE